MAQGHFFTIEGGEGSGKTSVIKHLTRWLNPNLFIFAHDPSAHDEDATLMRRLLLREDSNLSSNSRLLVYAAARAHLVDTVINPALDRGQSVICDRFEDSTRVYQGTMEGWPQEVIDYLSRLTHGPLYPTLTFLLDVDACVGLERSKARLKLQTVDEGYYEAKNTLYHEKVNEAYRKLAHESHARFRILNSNTRSIQDMAKEILDTILSEVNNESD